MKNERRVTINESGKLSPFTEKNISEVYHQVLVGSYGVVLPKTINLDNLDGLQLVDGKASVINDKKLAERIAEKTGGKLIEVTERFIREVVEVTK